MLDAFAFVVAEALLDPTLVAGALVDRDPDLPVGAGHRLGEEAGELALDVEKADLAEIEEARVEVRPHAQIAAAGVVGQMVRVIESRAIGLGLGFRGPAEIDVVDRAPVAVAIDEIQEAAG
jgi:hypothetical protein